MASTERPRDDSVSDSDEEMTIFPLTFCSDDDDDEDADESNSDEANANITDRSSHCHNHEDDGHPVHHEMEVGSPPAKPLMTLRQRRRSRLTPLNLNLSPIPTIDSPNIKHWKHAILKAKKLKDPWEEFNILDLPVEEVTRHRYSALRKQWITDTVKVRMEKKPFNRGAMRQCYRLKKMSTLSLSGDWRHASNYVAKRYMEDVDREVYFEDVRLQMDAKLWGEEYDRHNPPKKVDIFQMYVLEFKNREGCPLYHLEHFIEGKYIKYNSNSGFVEETSRLTPQAFSHFTFERSGHQLIVVDIQGVGDLYTDPQIHTAGAYDLSSGHEYGDGNLGPKGMALFFHSHVCNSICESLNLSKFDLAESEKKLQQKYIELMKDATTHTKGKEEVCLSASPRDQKNLHEFLRKRTVSGTSIGSDGDSDLLSPRSLEDEPMSADAADKAHLGIRWSISSSQSESSPRSSEPPSASDSGTMTIEEERLEFSRAVKQLSRPSCVIHEIQRRHTCNGTRMDDSVLGQVHHELAKYHEIGRFSTNGDTFNPEVDWHAALFHEEIAAQCGVMEAILTMAKIYLQMPHDVLQECNVQENEDNLNRGVDYMLQAADAGDRSAMLYMAKAYETGIGLGTERSRCFVEAIEFYGKALKMTENDESGSFDSAMEEPRHLILAKQAELYRQGGLNLEKDPLKSGELYNEAAEAAMEAMKGRLANKYYALAEEVWAECEDVEE
ncbi:eukaryotic elongation factor 2 kinase isoform X1 [Lingula anatina]|uniref:Eukaryotic elongation factor 2 kinase n=1 Tax=Lingula anatina TaxID=7574 RepID=A0A1S3I836_LINAN|nr:eukaryotic elongation factor 2 kinase isoform X1 [Lingula anatina]|eukprot:XP_013394430.1 eukaryotic elongation factor 2 kinase isoform X1 [Lingula anatina]